MKNKLFILSLFSILIASFNVFGSSNIKLEGGVIAPNQTLKVSLKKLIRDVDVYYDVTCNIYNENYSETDPVIVYFGIENSYQFYNVYMYLNGKSVSYWSGKGAELSKTQANNVYQAKKVALSKDKEYTAYLTFLNLDNDFSVEVKDCVAIPQT